LSPKKPKVWTALRDFSAAAAAWAEEPALDDDGAGLLDADAIRCAYLAFWGGRG
jgi:hypothetical protein